MLKHDKKIIIIEPNSTGGIALLKSAKRIGLEVHAVTHEDVYQEQYSNEIKKLIDYVLFTDFRNEAQAIKDITDYGKKIKVDGVVAGFEFTADTTVKVCTELKLPTHEFEKCSALRRKDLMHQCFYENEVACAKTIIVKSWEECLAATKELDFPLVIKPSSNAGSCYVFGVKNRDELENAYKTIKETNIEFPHGMILDDHILIQEYLQGPEFSVEIAVINGNINILTITDKLTSTGSYFAETGHTLPTNLNPLEQAIIEDMSKRAIAALGLKNGIAHVEVKLTSEGAKIIEVGARMPGDKIVDLLLHACGIDEGAVYLQISMGLVPDMTPKSNKFAAIRFLTSESEGFIRSINGIENIQVVGADENEGVLELEIYTQAGEKIDLPKNNIERVGHVIAISPNYNNVCKIVSEAISKIKIDLT